MAEIGYGYGSEFQLLRFLGHHRNILEKNIRNNSHFKNDFKWLDFPYANQRISLDGEYKGISFLKENIEKKEFQILKRKWKEYWPSSGNQQNWDAIFIHKDEFILVEAKAHLKEIESNISSKNKESKELIHNSLEKTKKYFGIQSNNDWTIKYYQIANRLAFIKFLTDNKIKTHLLNIYFLNGYIKRCFKDKKFVIEDKGVQSEELWEQEIKKQNDYLGITDSNAENFITSIFIDCMQ